MRTIAEELLLFALDDEKGTTVWSSSIALPYALAGALLADLALLGRVAFVDKHRVVVLDHTPTGDDLLDDALRLISASKKRRDAKYWVITLSGKVRRLRDRLEERLVEQGILQRDEHRVLFLFPFERHPTADPTVERGLRDQVRAVLLDDEKPTERIVVLISLLKSCNLLESVFTKDERSTVKERVGGVIESVPEGVEAGVAASVATAAVVAAAAAAAAAAVVVTSTT